MKPSTRQILERFDEPGAYEFHSAFRYPEMEARAKQVARNLESKGIRLTFEGAVHNQDASFSVALLLHDYELITEQVIIQPTIRFSNFGNLATVTFSERIPDSGMKQFIHELEACGFTHVPAEELDCDYDGVMEDKKTFSSWWIRYFDWI